MAFEIIEDVGDERKKYLCIGGPCDREYVLAPTTVSYVLHSDTVYRKVGWRCGCDKIEVLVVDDLTTETNQAKATLEALIEHYLKGLDNGL